MAFENIEGNGYSAGSLRFLFLSTCFLFYHRNSIIWAKFNPFPNKPWFLSVCCISLLKTLWEKEKLLVTSNFSFCHSVFYPFGEFSAIVITFEIVVCKLFEFGRVLNLSFGKGLNCHQHML